MRSHSSAQVQTSSKRTPSALTQRSCAPRGRVFASCSQQDPSTSSHAAARHEGREPGSQVLTSAARRQVLLLSSASLLGGALSRCLPAQAAGVYAPPPAGFRSFLDKLDGYTFYYPERWLPVTVTGKSRRSSCTAKQHRAGQWGGNGQLGQARRVSHSRPRLALSRQPRPARQPYLSG